MNEYLVVTSTTVADYRRLSQNTFEETFSLENSSNSGGMNRFVCLTNTLLCPVG